MKRLLAPILLLTLLFPALAFGETMKDLVERDGIHYKQFSDVPFMGKVTGKVQGAFKGGLKDGPWVRYWDNGKLWIAGNYKAGKADESWVRYWDNGQLLSKGTYKIGKRDGFFESYNIDGTIWDGISGIFKDDVKISD